VSGTSSPVSGTTHRASFAWRLVRRAALEAPTLCVRHLDEERRAPRSLLRCCPMNGSFCLGSIARSLCAVIVSAGIGCSVFLLSAPAQAQSIQCEDNAECGHGFECMPSGPGTSGSSSSSGAGGATGAECGNGVCELGLSETFFSCPEDCTTDAYCIPAECMIDGDCAEGYACEEEPLPGSSSTGSGSTCGDGICSSGEDEDSCAEDCTPTSRCRLETTTCTSDDECPEHSVCAAPPSGTSGGSGSNGSTGSFSSASTSGDMATTGEFAAEQRICVPESSASGSTGAGGEGSTSVGTSGTSTTSGAGGSVGATGTDAATTGSASSGDTGTSSSATTGGGPDRGGDSGCSTGRRASNGWLFGMGALAILLFGRGLRRRRAPRAA